MNAFNDTQAVIDVVARWAETEQANDGEGLAVVLADDFVGVGPLGFVLKRDQWLGRFHGGLKNRSFAVEQPEVHGHADAAVVVGILAQETSHQGGDSSGRFRVTLTAVRLDNAWRIASVHIGPLHEPHAAAAGQED